MENKATRLKITIPEPCHERWDKMTPTEKGAFCQSCEKEVMDFSGLQQEDIAYYFKYKDEGKTCGRFTKAQLNQTYIIPPETAPRRTWLRALWLLPFTLLSKNVFGQENKAPTNEHPQTDTIETTLGEGVVMPPDSMMQPQQQNQLTGHVRNAATGAALPLAVIKVNDSLQTTTDSTGNFALRLPEGFVVDSFIVTLEGFSGKYVPFKGDSVAGVRDIKLEPLFNLIPDATKMLINFSPENLDIYTLGWTYPINYKIEYTEVLSGDIVCIKEEEIFEEQTTIIHPEMLPEVPLHPLKAATEFMGNASEQPLPEMPFPWDEPKQDAVMPPPVVISSRKRK
jgi:hypothetical protein